MASEKSKSLVTGNGVIEVVKRPSSRGAKDGVFRLRHSLGKDPVTGKYKRSPRITVHGSYSDAEHELKRYKQRLNEGYAENQAHMGPMTLAQYLTTYHEMRQFEMKHNSYIRETQEIRELIDLFGTNIQLTELSPMMVRETYSKARAEGLHSAAELHKLHSTLKRALKQAVNDEILLRNPCEGISVPRPPDKEKMPPSVEEAKRFKQALIAYGQDSHTVATIVIVETGMRRGEALGLTWGNVDLDGRILSVKEQFTSLKEIDTPKSSKSKRDISITRETAEYLKVWKGAQKRLLAEHGIPQTERTPVAHILRRDESGHPLADYMDPNCYGRCSATSVSTRGSASTP